MDKIALIAPVRSIYKKASEIIKIENLKNIKVYYASLEEGESLARRLEQQGVKIIITRGGTYQMIRDVVDIPVIEIKTTTFDLVEALEDVEDINKKIAVVGYRRVISGFKSIKKIAQRHLEILEVKSQDDITNVISLARKNGIEVFIGDSTVIEITEKLNVDGILLSSTKASIKIAIDEAKDILKLTSAIRRKNEELLAMLSNVHDGIIIIDKNLEIVNINKKALDVTGNTNEDILGEKIRNVINTTRLPEVVKTGESTIGEIQSINNNKILTNRVPILIDGEIIGAIATFQPITEVLENEVKIRKELNKKGFVAKYKFENIIHESVEMKECINKAKIFAKYDAPVHITGETGVGKELFSQSIHNESKRVNKPFVAINCAALPASLIESELFGYEEGAFTGAKKKGKYGVFELAHSGTLFLDEISELPIDLQGRLLRAIQENEIIRVGGEEIINVDVRLITASNKNLLDLVRKGEFREDLYYRIHVLSLGIPPLRERNIDIILLSEYFIDKYSKKHSVKKIQLTEDIKKDLLNYKYYGNVRELENLIEVSVLLGSFQELKKEVKKEKIYSNDLDFNDLKTLEEVELDYIKKVYNKNSENVELTARELGISRTTLWRKLKES